MSFLLIVQGVISGLLTFCILCQQRAAGITASFGGVNTAYVQRRGAEKLLYQMTVVLGISMMILIVVQWYM